MPSFLRECGDARQGTLSDARRAISTGDRCIIPSLGDGELRYREVVPDWENAQLLLTQAEMQTCAVDSGDCRVDTRLS